MKALSPLRARWTGLAPREKVMVASALGLVAAAIVWWLLVAPALATLRTSEAQRHELDAQLQSMRALQAQAKALQSQPKAGYDEALRLLELSVRERLGTTGRLSLQGERATITLTGTAPDTVAQWLAQARVNARALPSDVRINRNAAGQWEGTVVFTLPSR
ncbi:type II secretion system protein GspM [Caenimonas koreensis]|uniref:type II secretion system protein GspM n=1 Tax=Caenimonas koreensis TaxID=367474 RepID=UPI003784A040